jgi:hypothetical protein
LWTNVTDAGLEHLSALNLHVLNLGGARVGDDGLAYVKQMKTLRWRLLGSTRVTDAGLEYVTGFPRLNHLRLEHTNNVFWAPP